MKSSAIRVCVNAHSILRISDAELLTIEIFGDMQGYNSDPAVWGYSREHTGGIIFPNWVAKMLGPGA